MDLGRLNLLAWWPTRVIVLVLAIVCLLVAIFLVRSRWARIGVGALCLVFVVLTVGGVVNAYFGYYPQLRDALGYRGEDAVDFDQLDTSKVPANGKLVEYDIPATTSGFIAQASQVYLPPAWFETPKPALPVIVLLQGSPGETTDWSLGGKATQTADAFATQNNGVAPVLVMADPNGDEFGDTECVDTAGSKPEVYLTQDVPAAIQQQFGTAAPGKDWAIAGLSEGGMCSLMLTLRNPDVFGAFGDFGGLIGPRSGDGNEVGSTVKDLFGGSQQEFDEHEPKTLLAANTYPAIGGWFEVGTADGGPLEAAKTLVPLAETAQIDTCFVPVPGGEHTFDVWSKAFEDSLPWFAARFGLVEQTAAMTADCTTP